MLPVKQISLREHVALLDILAGLQDQDESWRHIPVAESGQHLQLKPAADLRTDREKERLGGV